MSPSRALPLMELTTLQSVVCDRRRGPIGLPTPAASPRFRGALRYIRRSPSPIACAMGSSSRELRLSFRVLRSVPAHNLAIVSTSLGVSFPIATSTGGVHVRGHPRPASFRPRRFSRPRRLAPPPALRVYFTPQPRPGFTLQGFSLRRSRTTSSVAVALVTFHRFRCHRLPDGATVTAPSSGPCSAPESVAPRGGLDLASPDPLLGLPSPGCSVHPPWCRFHGPSAPGLPRASVQARTRG